MDINWFEKQAVLLDTELQALINDKIWRKLQNRMLESEAEEDQQPGLIKFLNAAIDDFASKSPRNVKVIKITRTIVYVVVRLLSNLYTYTNKKFNTI
jgi:hypothetical protein